MDGRDTQQEKDGKGEKVESPNSDTFQTKLSSLASRAKQISGTPLKTLIHLVDKEWMEDRGVGFAKERHMELTQSAPKNMVKIWKQI